MAQIFQHDATILGIAACLCILASVASANLVQRAWAEGKGAMGRWGHMATATLGIGIWAPQFLLMLSCAPVTVRGYDLPLTLGSLLVSVGLSVLVVRCGAARRPLAGVVFGLAAVIASITGLLSLGGAGRIVWQSEAVLAAMVLSAVLGAGSLTLLRPGGIARRGPGMAGMAITLGVAHLLAVRAATVRPALVPDEAATLLPVELALAITVATYVLLAVPLFAWLLDARDRRLGEVQEHRLRELANVSQEGLFTSIDGVIAGCNLSFRFLTGFDAGIATAKVIPDAAMLVLRANPGRMEEIEIGTRDGQSIPVEATLRLVSLGGGVAEAVALRDLRKRRADEAESERTARARLEAERRFRFLIQSVTDYAIYMLTPEGFIANWNAGAQRNKGYTTDEIVGKHFSIFFSDRDRADRVPHRMLDRAIYEGKVEVEGWRYRKDGSRFWAHVLLEPIFDDDGRHIGFVKVTQDNTRQKEDAEKIATISRNLTAALENMIQGIALFDMTEKLVLANARLTQILGMADPQGMSMTQFMTDLSTRLDPQSPPAGDLYRTDGQGIRQRTLELADGRSLLVAHRAIPEGGWVSTFEDVSERTRSERQIVHMARHDTLTGLPNRASFAENLAWALDDAAERDGMQVAVLGIDLDRFKEINDHLGHAVGDDVLIDIAKRLGAALRNEEFLARFGGDEFAAYKTFRHRDEMAEFAKRLLDIICDPILLGQNELSVGASIGIALFPEDGHVGDKLISNADMAMYRAKSSITDKICFYEVEMDEASRSRRQMARDLWRAVEREEMYLHHQIQKSVTTGETTGYEVLLRWQHPEKGNISPVDFIPVAEECGAILPIGDWVLRTACEQAAGFASKVRIAVNLSPVQLGNPRFVDTLQTILNDTGLEPWRLELEVTESAIIADKAWALHMLEQIKALGVTIAIDDFGTGYSSLETLRSFPFDKIKLDRSFIREVETSRQAKAIVRAILALGRSLEVPILAEGVETMEQLHLLRSEGCDEAQGFLLGRPGRLEQVMPEPAIAGQVA